MDEFTEMQEALAALQDDALAVLTEVQSHTLNARRAMDRSPVDINTLANEIVELSILNQRLGDRVANAGGLSRQSENYYKTVREEHKLRLVTEGSPVQTVDDNPENPTLRTVTKMVKMAAGVADSAKMKLSAKEFKLYNEATVLYEKLQFMRKSSDKTIDAIRSKLSFEKMDYKNAS